MARLTNAELQRRIEELESENSVLRTRSAAAASVVAPAQMGTATRQRGWAWTLLAAVLIVVGALVAPLAVVGSWASTTLSDTEKFVAEYAPLAKDPAVQGFLSDQVVAVINEHVDVTALTSEVIDGITGLGTGPVATRALDALKGPAAAGITSLMHSTVSNFVESDAFADVWASALRVSHTQLVAAMRNDPSAALALGSDGSVGIALGPIIDAVKVALVDQGIGVAAQIPAINRTVVLAQSDALPTIQLAYGLAVSAVAWLPLFGVLLLVAGVLVARRRFVALIWAAIALAITMTLTAIAFAVGNIFVVTTISPAVVPTTVTTLLYETLTDGMREVSIAVIVLAISVAVVAWLAGPFVTPRRMRALVTSGAASIRAALEPRGLGTGRFGGWLYKQHTLVRVAIALIGAAIVLFVRPLTPGLIVWTLVVAAVVLAVVELLQRPPAKPHPLTNS